MAYGLFLNNYDTTTLGGSFAGKFYYTAGTPTSVSYIAPTYVYAKEIIVYLSPGSNTPANTVPGIPQVEKQINTAQNRLTVSVYGGNISCWVLVFVR